MILFIALLTCLTFAFFAGVLQKHSKKHNYDDAMGWWGIISCVLVIIMVLANGVQYAIQIYSFEDLKAVDAKIVLYEKKTDNLSAEFTMILNKQYPDHELEIFKDMTPENAQMVFTKYPELKASLTAVKLVEELSYLYDDLYDLQEDKIEQVRAINWRNVNPWTLRWIIPNPPNGIDN